ncbi:MAG: hypothetical protein JSV49_05285 [Thermoplasmata archaeon]|nr:MAG: hypothetical protein JSV49_05285 [Thermoplasmata archaeon]
MSLILVRYNELGLKSPKVRRRFQQKLIENIQDRFFRNKIECVVDSQWGRIFVHTNDIDNGVRLLKKIFGIASVSIVETGTGGLNNIIDAVLEYSKDILQSGQSFAVRTRRHGSHEFTSMDLAKKLGAEILKKFKDRDISVNLSSPDVKIFVEVRNDTFYIFSKKIRAVGGLPLGTQGRIIGIYENKNSFLAWWMMMKRGATIIPVYPVRSQVKSIEEIEELEDNQEFKKYYNILKNWVPVLKFRFYQIPENESNDQLSRIQLYSRVINHMSIRFRVEGIVSGMTINDFKADLELMDKKDKDIFNFPIFLPLIGMSESEISLIEEGILETD